MVFDSIVLAGSLMESSDSGSLSMQNRVQCSLLDMLVGNEVIPEMPGFHAQSLGRFVDRRYAGHCNQLRRIKHHSGFPGGFKPFVASCQNQLQSIVGSMGSDRDQEISGKK